MSDINYQQLAEALINQSGSGVRHKAVPSTPNAVYGHGGKGGLFSTPGLSKALFSAMVLPNTGLASKLPVRESNETNPLYGILTGVTASSGSEPVGPCDDPPQAGLSKLCTHQFVFGRLSRSSRVYDIDRIGLTINRADMMDFNVFGNPLGNNPLAPTGMTDAAAIARNEVAKSMFEMGVAWSRDFARLTYTGTPTNNTASNGYMEFYGLESLVNTGYRDALTGIACPAADSIVFDFGSLDVASNGNAIVKLISYTWRNLRFIAKRAGLDPVTWTITMPFGLFYALTEIWPIAYQTTAASVIPTGATLFVGSESQVTARDAMRGNLYDYTGQYLMIDGQMVPVTIDDAITETQSGASFISDIYFVPLQVLGGIPVTYWESFNYDGANGPLEFARQFAPGDSYYTSDNGRFLWHKKPPTNFCVQVIAKMQPRLLLLTPYLAARITNVKYTPIEHERSWDPTNAYFVNGGSTQQDTTVPSYYSPTA